MSELFFKSIPQPVYVYDKESLTFLDVNDAALNLYGYSRDEFLQMDLTDLYTPDDIQIILDASKEIIKSGVFSKPLKHRKKNGSYATVKISKIDYNFNNVESFLHILQDVSDIFELEKNKQVFKAAFDNTNDMIFITDPEGIITYVNESVQENIGTSESDLVNTSITFLLDEEDKIFINNSVFKSNIKETVTFRVELKTSEGNIIESDVVSTPIFNVDNKITSFVLIAKSATISQSNNSTNKKFGNENGTVRKTEVNEYNSLNFDNTFFAGVFHEILTPINVILGFSQELSESISNPSPEQQETINILNQNRTALINLMHSIVEFSDLQYNKEESDISEVHITEIMKVFDKSISEITGIKDLEIAYGKISSSLKFIIDKKKLISLLNNIFQLISGISSENKLYFSAYPIDNNNFIISVSDSFGKSSAPLIQTLKLFFIDKKDPKLLGITKLNSQIVNTLLESLNGKFVEIGENTDKHDVGFKFPLQLSEEIESSTSGIYEESITDVEEPTEQEKIQDSKFKKLSVIEEIEFEEEEEIINSLNQKTINSKITDLGQENIIQKVKESVNEMDVSLKENQENFLVKNGLSSLRCLYIEDQVDSQFLFKVQMKDLKNIQFAVSFEEALPLLESKDFDFIIMDLNLEGEYTGLDALKIIHKMPKYENIPVIAVTAFVLPGDKEKFIATGFTDFISKPIFREKLIESLKKIFFN